MSTKREGKFPLSSNFSLFTSQVCTTWSIIRGSIMPRLQAFPNITISNQIKYFSWNFEIFKKQNPPMYRAHRSYEVQISYMSYDWHPIILLFFSSVGRSASSTFSYASKKRGKIYYIMQACFWTTIYVQILLFFVTQILTSHSFFFYFADLHDIYGG